jgi:cell division protein ZapB
MAAIVALGAMATYAVQRNPVTCDKCITQRHHTDVMIIVLRFSPDSPFIDPAVTHLHNRPMNDSSSRTAIDQEMRKLEKRMDELLATVNQLKEENRALRQRQDTLMTERATLLQKNEQVRARVEAMIGRLKAMEHNA